MSTPHISVTPKPGQFCLWKLHSWGEVEQELTEMSGTNHAQPATPQQASPEPLHPQSQPYMPPLTLFHQYPFNWEPAYSDSGSEPAYYSPDYRILDAPASSQLFTLYFWLGGPIDPLNIPGCSEYLPITVTGDMKLTDIFEAYFLFVDAGMQLEFCNIMQVVFRDGEPREGTHNYYQGAKCTGITVKETQWYAWRGFWLVGCDREGAFREACEKVKKHELL